MTALLGSARVAKALADGRHVVNRGIGGQRSYEVAGRQRGIQVTAVVAGEKIPASGAVAISRLFPTIARCTKAGVAVSIAGVTGTLRPIGEAVSPTGYEFVRSAPGNAVSAFGSQVVTPVTTDKVDNKVFDLNEYTAIFWLGRNGLGGPGTDVTVYAQMLARITNAEKRVLILPVFNGGYASESNGDPAIPTRSTSSYTSIMDRNAALAEAYPQYWYDIRRDFIDGAEAWLRSNHPAVYASDWRQFFPNRTDANLGPDSAWDVANDVPPRALRRDKVHLNELGNEFLAQLIAVKLKSRGW
jgi:lysophospholipase L1-like esterase